MQEIKGKAVILEFNTIFYPKNILKIAIRDFRGVCSGEIKQGKRAIVILKPKDKDLLGSIGLEFCNYALALMKNKSIV